MTRTSFEDPGGVDGESLLGAASISSSSFTALPINEEEEEAAFCRLLEQHPDTDDDV